MHTTTRLGLDVPDGTDAVNAYPAAASQALGVLDNAAIYQEGTLASKPTPGVSNHGYLYRTTDAGVETLSWSDGSLWHPLGLVPVNVSTNITVASGQCVITGGGSNRTVTLPAHVSGQIVGIVNATAVNVATTVSGTTIYGPGLSNATSFTLGTIGASAVLIDDGNAWNFLAGQQDTGWVPVTLAANCSTPAGFLAAAARLRGDRVWLKGTINSSANQSARGTIPSTAMYPTATVWIGTSLSNNIQVTSAGALGLNGPEGPGSIGLDGKSYTLS